MGYDKYVYVGPYIELNGKLPSIEKEKKIGYNICPNETCEIHGKNINGKYCPECGNPAEKGFRIEKYYDTSSINDIMYEFGEEDIMYSPEYQRSVLLPNNIATIRDIVLRPGDDDFAGEIPNSDLAKDKFMRDERYSKFLCFLDSKGVNYTVKFGLVSYWS